MLRSCYSTQAVIEDGKPPVQIDWWFTDKPLTLTHHQFGSLNWQKGRIPPGALGEVVGAPRPWRSGARPLGACGAAVPHHPLATVTIPGCNTSTFALAPQSQPLYWLGLAPVAYGRCITVQVELRLLGAGTVTDPYLWQVFLQGIPLIGAAFEDLRTFPTSDPNQPLDLTLPLTSLDPGCCTSTGGASTCHIHEPLSPP